MKHKYQVGRQTYWVQLSEDIERGTWGACYIEEKKIEIKKNLSQKNLSQTLIHELFHALCKEYGIKLTEEQVLKLDSAVSRFIKDNYRLTWRKLLKLL